MVDTFTCDSCGRNNVPTDNKTKLLIKDVIATGGTTKRGKPEKATVTLGMAVCPECKMKGIIHNHLEVDDDKRQFGWHPSKELESTFAWGRDGFGQSTEPATK